MLDALTMSRNAAKLLTDALQLPPSERAELATELIASLDGKADRDVETAWAAEIERRVAELEAGRSAGASWDDVRRRIERDILDR